MATLEKPLGLGVPDSGVYPSTLNAEMTLTNPKYQECMVMPAPSGADIGVHIGFTVPQQYASTPVLVIRGVLDGTPANIIAFGAQQLARSTSDAIDTAYEAEDTISNSTWTGYTDEDFYEITITLTPGSAYTPGQWVMLWLYRDDSVDTTTFNFLLTETAFRYNT